MIDKIKNMKNKLMKTELEEARDAYNASQNKNLYTEEDLLNFGAFVRIEDKTEKRLFLIQGYFKKWVESKESQRTSVVGVVNNMTKTRSIN